MKRKLIALGITLVLIAGMLGYLYYDTTKTASTSASKTQSTDTINSEDKKITNSNENKSTATSDSTSKSTAKADTNTNTNSKTTSSTTTFTNSNLSYDNYIASLTTVDYTMVSGDTLTSIARKYESTCTLGTATKLINAFNNITDASTLSIGTIIKVPEKAFTSGTLYKVQEGDTWGKIANEYYSNFDTDKITSFLVDINSLPNDYLPLGETIFLPKLG